MPDRKRKRSGAASRAPARAGGTSPAEWIVAAVATLLVLGAIGHLVYQAVSQPDSPPLLTVSADSVVSRGDDHVVLFTIENAGGTTAAAVTVEGELRRDSTTVQRSSAIIDYVPAHAHRAGGLLFQHDPGDYALELRATGYEEP